MEPSLSLQLSRAVYVSQAVGGAGANLLSLSEILGVSDRNNRRDGLTGVLLFHRGVFMQALEGERSGIDRLLRKLETDARHRNIRILSIDPIQRRAFGDWAMGQAMITPELAPLLAGRELDALAPESALALLVQASPRIARPASAD